MKCKHPLYTMYEEITADPKWFIFCFQTFRQEKEQLTYSNLALVNYKTKSQGRHNLEMTPETPLCLSKSSCAQMKGFWETYRSQGDNTSDTPGITTRSVSQIKGMWVTIGTGFGADRL